MRWKLGLLVAIVLTVSLCLAAQGPKGAPLNQKETADLIKENKKDLQKVGPVLSQRGVDFELTPDIEKKLRKAGADDQVISAMKNAGPAARAAQKAQLMGRTQGQQGEISSEERQAYDAIQNELDPDRAVQLVSDFEKKFPNSAQLTYVYAFGANAFQQKNDIEHTVEYGDKSLKLKPDNLFSLIIMSQMLPQPQLMKGSEAEKEKRLGEAEEDANRALQLIDKLDKLPNETDEAFQKRKAQLALEPHSALGMVHLQRSAMGLEGLDTDELSKAAEEYKLAVSTTDHPNAQDYYRLGEAYTLLKKYDEAIDAFTKAGEVSQGNVIKTYADERIEELKKKKALSSPPAKP